MKILSSILAKLATALFLIGEPKIYCTATKTEQVNTIRDEDIIKNHTPLIRGGKLDPTPIQCTFSEAHVLPTRENRGNHTVVQPHHHCHDTDSDLVYHLEGISDEHVRALSLQSGHTKLKIPFHFKKEADASVLHIEDPSALIVSNDHQDRRQLTRTGQYKVLVVLVTDRFGNRPSQSEAKMANDVFQDRVNLRERFRACSKNKLDFVPATGPRVNNGVITVQTSSSLRGISYTDCGNLASRALPSGISRTYIMYVCPDVTRFRGAAVGQKPGSITWYLSEYASAADVQVHELGHNLGFHHSGTNLGDREYDDGTCHMSNEGGFTDESRNFCFNAAKYHYSNWFPEFSTTVTPTSRNFKGNLVGIDDVVSNRANSGNQELTVKIQGSGQTDLFMMFNRKKGINSEVPEHGNKVVIVSQSSPSAISVRIAALSTGQTHTINNWANSGNALKIKVCSINNGGDVASVIAYLENVNNISCGSGGETEGTFIKSAVWNTFLRFNSNRDVDFTTNQMEWEKIALEKVDGDKYVIKSAFHSNMYLRVGGPGEGNVVNTQTYIGSWEKFYIEKLDGGRVAFKSAEHGNYLRVHGNGHLDTQTFIGPWEQFEIIGGNGGDGNVLTKFHFYQMMDSHGNDIKWSNAGGIEAYAKECMMMTDCQGFNSNGWLKRTVRPQSEWNKWTSDNTKGFYVKK